MVLGAPRPIFQNIAGPMHRPHSLLHRPHGIISAAQVAHELLELNFRRIIAMGSRREESGGGLAAVGSPINNQRYCPCIAHDRWTVQPPSALVSTQQEGRTRERLTRPACNSSGVVPQATSDGVHRRANPDSGAPRGRSTPQPRGVDGTYKHSRS